MKEFRPARLAVYWRLSLFANGGIETCQLFQHSKSQRQVIVKCIGMNLRKLPEKFL